MLGFLRHFAVPVALCTGLIAFSAVSIHAAAKNTGRWTSAPHWNWNNTPIHLMLLPSGSGGYHSRVLWWEDNHHDEYDDLQGGLWGWSRADTLSCIAPASSHFTNLEWLAPSQNIFCAGSTPLVDGRTLVVGGTEKGEVGLNSALIFDPDLSGQWTAVQNTSERRWYPTLTRGSDGKITVSSGSKYSHLHIVGGRTSKESDTLATRGLRRLGLNSAGTWDGAKYEPASYVSSFRDWPGRIAGHTLTPREFYSDQGTAWGRNVIVDLVFGGDTLKNGAWVSSSKLLEMKRFDQRRLGDYDYTFVRLEPATNPLHVADLPRADHVMVPDNFLPSVGSTRGMIVFGGRSRPEGLPTVVRNDTWHLFYDQSIPNWRWVRRLDGAQANTPSPRFGHAAIYDPIHKRMLVWGGTADSSSGPVSGAEADVFALNLRDPSAPYWYKPNNVTAPSGVPATRFGHRMLFDNVKRKRATTWQYRAVLFGGKTGTGVTGLKNDMWSLWIDPADSSKLEWRPVQVSGAPSPRAWPVFAIDGYRLLAFGGEMATASNDRRFFELPLPSTNEDYPQNTDAVTFSWNMLAEAQADTAWVGAAGLSTFPPAFARTSDQYEVNGATRTALTSSPLLEAWYPQHFQHTDGSLIAVGPRDTSFRLPSAGGWECFPAGACNTNMGVHGSGAAVMWEPGKVMICGSPDELPGTAEATRLSRWNDFEVAGAPWRASPDSMVHRRVNHNAVILPNGNVFVIGGTAMVDSNSMAVHQPEMWLPYVVNGNGVRGDWIQSLNGEALAQHELRRGYHSTAILLPDGRVLSAGGNNDPTHETRVQIYCPPYLFGNDGNVVAPRPRIQSTARGPVATNPYAHMQYGQQLAVCVDGATGNLDSLKAVLMAPGMATHGFDQNQRRVPLAVSYCGTGSRVQITGPSNANHAPPGYYLLFLLNDQGVPSVAEWVKVGADSISTMAPSCSTCAGSGCPELDVKTAAGWQTENTILARSLTGELGYDACRLALTPDAADGTIRLRLRENEQEVTTLDETRLLAVDHAPGNKVLGFGGGAVTGNWAPATRVTTSTGEDITTLVSGEEAGWWGSPGDTVLIELDPRRAGFGAQAAQDGGGGGTLGGDPKEQDLRYDPGSSGGASRMQPAATPALVTDADWLQRTGVRIQRLSGEGDWSDVAHWYPRQYSDETYLPGLGTGTTRLIFVGRHRLTSIGRLVPAAGGVTVHSLAPTTATHSRLGPVSSDVSPAGSTTMMAPGDTVNLAFSPPPLAEGLVRSYILVTRGVYTSNVGATRMQPSGPRLPVRFALLQNRPNPFKSSTTIQFELPRSARVKLEIFDLLGRRLRTLTDQEWPAGYHHVEWDRTTESGTLMRSGVYVYRITAGSFREQRKMVLSPR